VKFLEPMGLILILLIVLVLFGPKRLPDLGKSMRKGMRAFKEEVDPETDAASASTAKDSAPTDEDSGGQPKT